MPNKHEEGMMENFRMLSGNRLKKSKKLRCLEAGKKNNLPVYRSRGTEQYIRNGGKVRYKLCKSIEYPEKRRKRTRLANTGRQKSKILPMKLQSPRCLGKLNTRLFRPSHKVHARGFSRLGAIDASGKFETRRENEVIKQSCLALTRGDSGKRSRKSN